MASKRPALSATPAGSANRPKLLSLSSSLIVAICQCLALGELPQLAKTSKTLRHLCSLSLDGDEESASLALKTRHVLDFDSLPGFSCSLPVGFGLSAQEGRPAGGWIRSAYRRAHRATAIVIRAPVDSMYNWLYWGESVALNIMSHLLEYLFCHSEKLGDRLKHLELPWIKSTSLAQLYSSCPNLVFLSIGEIEQPLNEGVLGRPALPVLHHLQRIAFATSGTKMWRSAVQRHWLLAACPNVIEIHVNEWYDEVNTTDDQLVRLHQQLVPLQLGRLQVLDIKQNSTMNMKTVVLWPQLVELRVQHIILSPDTPGRMPNLERLCVRSIRASTDAPLSTDVLNLLDLPRLRQLKIEHIGALHLTPNVAVDFLVSLATNVEELHVESRAYAFHEISGQELERARLVLPRVQKLVLPTPFKLALLDLVAKQGH